MDWGWVGLGWVGLDGVGVGRSRGGVAAERGVVGIVGGE